MMILGDNICGNLNREMKGIHIIVVPIARTALVVLNQL